MSNEWLDRDKMADRKAEYLAIAENPAAMALVQSRTKPSLKRVADIPVLCGGHDTGFFVSLKVDGEMIRVMYLRQASMPEHMRPDGVTPGNAPAAPLDLHCAQCGKRTNRAAAWVLREALKTMTTRRPSIRV